jgi:riboflavin kinase/FMN adenylyltransferase
MSDKVRIFRDWRDLPADARGGSVAHVLRTAHGARPDAPRAVLTFEPHPREHFRPDDPPFRLTLSAERAAALARLDVQVVYEMPFDAAFSLMTADRFVADVLHAGLGARHLVIGPDFAFGHRRGGDSSFLAARAEALGIGMTIATQLSDESGPISSTRIRRALQDGYPERATALLGRPWAVVGPVTHGDKRGRTIGFPTANVPLGRHLEPARGVYAVTVKLPDGSQHAGVANIGRRPTVNAGTESRLEVNLFDYQGDLYGSEIAVSLHAFLRGERRFPGIDALRAQIAADAADARALLDRAAAASP